MPRAVHRRVFVCMHRRCCPRKIDHRPAVLVVTATSRCGKRRRVASYRRSQGRGTPVANLRSMTSSAHV
uniref:Uncharacterized protein n=1 Tax=Oryza punctata TaxID=4537 RepID=A0A0E0MFP6_ORYPU